MIALGVAANLHASPAAEAPPADPADCAAIEADAVRLACYDALFRKTASGQQPAAEQVAAAAVAESKFGITQRTTARAETFKQLDSRVVTISKQTAGRTLLTLANGQRWLTTSAADSDYFRPGDQITIRPAALGSFLAKKEDLNRTVRIRRID